jgi:hypothetical protein
VNRREGQPHLACACHNTRASLLETTSTTRLLCSTRPQLFRLCEILSDRSKSIQFAPSPFPPSSSNSPSSQPEPPPLSNSGTIQGSCLTLNRMMDPGLCVCCPTRLWLIH